MPPGRKGSRRTRDPPEANLAEYEKQRAVNIMKNNQMFQQLGISQLKTLMTASTTNNRDDGRQESGSLYDGDASDGSEQEEVSKDSHVAKGVRSQISNDVCGTPTKGTTGSKRVLAPDVHQHPVRVTRQRIAAINQETTQTLNDATHLRSRASTNQESTQTLIGTTETTPSAATNQDPSQGMVATEQPSSQTEAEVDDLTGDVELVPRQRSMGRNLESLSRGLGIRIPIQISEGNRRPEPPIQAAKFASEGGIILRQHIPILPHWKEYKKKENVSKVKNYIGKLAGQFTMDVENKAVNDACVDMLKGGQRQMRYKLKCKYFNGVPADQVRTTSPVSCMNNDQWNALVHKWSSTEHKENCIKNRLNREKVQFPQCTGSQSYIAKAYSVKQEKYKDSEPSAIDLFKEMHCSKKKGFTQTVKKAMDDMEEIVAAPVEDGQPAKSSTEVVSQVLPSSSLFLRNVGLRSASKTNSTGSVSSRVYELQSQLDMERQEKDLLREEMETLKTKSQASEATIANQSSEIEDMKKSLAENNSLFRQILSINRGQAAPP